MASISDLVRSYGSSPRMKAKLKIEIKLDDGTVYPIGTVSDLLISKGNGQYHFEADNSACTVTANEIEFI